MFLKVAEILPDPEANTVSKLLNVDGCAFSPIFVISDIGLRAS
jgi:hypothetical protein